MIRVKIQKNHLDSIRTFASNFSFTSKFSYVILVEVSRIIWEVTFVIYKKNSVFFCRHNFSCTFCRFHLPVFCFPKIFLGFFFVFFFYWLLSFKFFCFFLMIQIFKNFFGSVTVSFQESFFFGCFFLYPAFL